MELSCVLLLGLAVSMDGLFAGIAYGVKGIHIPLRALAAIGAATFFYTGIAVGGAQYLTVILPPEYAFSCGALLLIGLGTIALFRQFFSNETKSSLRSPKALTVSLGKIVIQIMEKPECADMDHSNQLSIAEALLLGTALGIDNMTAAFAAGLANGLPLYTPLAMCAIQTTLVYGGIKAATKIVSSNLKRRLAYAPGAALILIGLSRFF